MYKAQGEAEDVQNEDDPTPSLEPEIPGPPTGPEVPGPPPSPLSDVAHSKLNRQLKLQEARKAAGEMSALDEIVQDDENADSLTQDSAEALEYQQVQDVKN